MVWSQKPTKVISLLVATLMAAPSASSQDEQDYDAIRVAGNHHRLLFEKESVRVLEVVIPPGETTEFHSHPMPGVFITNQPASRISRNLDGEIFKTTKREDFDPSQPAQWREVSGMPVSVTVTDSVAMKTTRVEMKGTGNID